MSDAFRCLGKAARAALCAIARHLCLRSDVFNYLLDDIPLPTNEVSSSVLVSTYSHASLPNIKGSKGVGKSSNPEVEKGLLTLITSDNPGIQVDELIVKDHIFKRNIIVIKDWFYYESCVLGDHHGLISTYALETLVLYIFHLFHSSLDGPFAGFWSIFLKGEDQCADATSS